MRRPDRLATVAVLRPIAPLLAAVALFAALAGGASADLGLLSACTSAPPVADPARPAPVAAVASYPVEPATAITKTSATLTALVNTAGLSGEAAFELTSSDGTVRCTTRRPLLAISGPQTVSAQLRSERPGTTVAFRIVVTTDGGQIVGFDEEFTTVAPIVRLPAGTTILGVRVGFLTPEAAQARVLKHFARPLVFTYRGKRWTATPRQLGATVDVAGALARSLASTSDGRVVPVKVAIDPARVSRYVAYLDGLYSRDARTGSVRRVGRRAEVVVPQTAIEMQTRKMESAIARTLKATVRAPIELQVTETQPTGPGRLLIVVRLAEQSLTLYKDGAVVIRTPVTTGRPALPTPVGSYDIAWRKSPYTFISPWPQGDPFYYPPAHVRWAMFFFDNDFLHDSSEPASAYGKGSNLGPYASHGCVHVPSGVMQQLYTTVPDHTPLVVVQA